MEREEAWEPTTRIPILDEDILEVLVEHQHGLSASCALHVVSCSE